MRTLRKSRSRVPGVGVDLGVVASLEVVAAAASVSVAVVAADGAVVEVADGAVVGAAEAAASLASGALAVGGVVGAVTTTGRG